MTDKQWNSAEILAAQATLNELEQRLAVDDPNEDLEELEPGC